MEIERTKGRLAVIDDEDWPIAEPLIWYTVYSEESGHYYAATNALLPNGKIATLFMTNFTCLDY
jgi:hypothetical protein